MNTSVTRVGVRRGRGDELCIRDAYNCLTDRRHHSGRFNLPAWIGTNTYFGTHGCNASWFLWLVSAARLCCLGGLSGGLFSRIF